MSTTRTVWTVVGTFHDTLRAPEVHVLPTVEAARTLLAMLRSDEDMEQAVLNKHTV